MGVNLNHRSWWFDATPMEAVRYVAHNSLPRFLPPPGLGLLTGRGVIYPHSSRACEPAAAGLTIL